MVPTCRTGQQRPTKGQRLELQPLLIRVNTHSNMLKRTHGAGVFSYAATREFTLSETLQCKISIWIRPSADKTFSALFRREKGTKLVWMNSLVIEFERPVDVHAVWITAFWLDERGLTKNQNSAVTWPFYILYLLLVLHEPFFLHLYDTSDVKPSFLLSEQGGFLVVLVGPSLFCLTCSFCFLFSHCELSKIVFLFDFCYCCCSRHELDDATEQSHLFLLCSTGLPEDVVIHFVRCDTINKLNYWKERKCIYWVSFNSKSPVIFLWKVQESRPVPIYFDYRSVTDISVGNISSYRYQSEISMLRMIHTSSTYYEVRSVRKAASSDTTQNNSHQQ